MDKDEFGTGKVNLKVFYDQGKRTKLVMDRDGDGRFEITQWFDKSPWSVVMEVDLDGDGRADGRYCYRENTLRVKEIDEDGDGRLDFREHYDEKGRLVKIEERDEGAQNLNLIWIYDDSGQAIRAEKDADEDGRIDTWYAYREGRIAKVEEDTNRDGKPDIWEEYTEAEELAKRSKDFNFDGKPDMEEIPPVK